MKEFINALWALMTFKPYTYFPRFMEIIMGIEAWLSLLLIIYAITKN